MRTNEYDPRFDIQTVEGAVRAWGSVDKAWEMEYRNLLPRAAFRAYVKTGLL